MIEPVIATAQRSKAIGRQTDAANPLAFAKRALPSEAIAIAEPFSAARDAVTILRKVDDRNHSDFETQ